MLWNLEPSLPQWTRKPEGVLEVFSLFAPWTESKFCFQSYLSQRRCCRDPGEHPALVLSKLLFHLPEASQLT